MNAMASTEKAITAITGLNHSGLITVEAILGGYETPLIDHYNLRDLVEDFRKANPQELSDAMVERREALNSRKRVVVGQGQLLGGIFYDVVEYR